MRDGATRRIETPERRREDAVSLLLQGLDGRLVDLGIGRVEHDQPLLPRCLTSDVSSFEQQRSIRIRTADLGDQRAATFRGRAS